MTSSADLFDDAAVIAERVAVLIGSGMPPDAAFRAAGKIRRAQAHQLAPLIEVALHSGAPLGPALNAYAATLRDSAAAARGHDVAIAGPRATVRLITWLPIAGLVLAALLGFDVVHAISGSAIGSVCAGAGIALGVLGSVWSKKIMAMAAPRPEIVGMLFDLVALGLRGGLPAEDALRLARSRLPLQPGAEDGSDDSGDAGAVRAVLTFGLHSGVPVAALLHAEASLIRRRRVSEALMAVEQVSAKLLAPLGLCVLPSFLLLGVAPVVLSIVSSTVSGM